MASTVRLPSHLRPWPVHLLNEKVGSRPSRSSTVTAGRNSKNLTSHTVDAIITDPIYPEVHREYGRISEGDWHAMMRDVVTECRRVLKPKGSAVFIFQPNYEKIGKMRLWLWEFMAWAGRRVELDPRRVLVGH